MYRVLALCMLVPLYCLANQVTQTDWSTGPGVSGPALNWGASFLECSDVSWAAVYGQICLSSEPLGESVIHPLDTSFYHAYTAEAGDLNGDGLMDVVVGGGESYRVYLSDGQGGWSIDDLVTGISGACGVDLADIDEDGQLDILCAIYFDGTILLLTSEGSADLSWTETLISDGFDGAHDVEAVDLDLDGDLDILAVAAEADIVRWWRNDGGTPVQWTARDISTKIEYPCRVQGVDLDGDGCMDVVASAWEGDEVTVWYGSGGAEPSWAMQTVYSPVYGAHSVKARDMDGDGDHDLVVAALNGGSLLLFRNLGGSPAGWERLVIDQFASCGYAEPGDMDGDGDLDIVASSFGSAGIAWWENTGGASSWTQHYVANGLGTLACARASDMDTDGDLDILVTGYGQGRADWFQITEFKPSGSMTSSILDTAGQPQWASMDWEVRSPWSTSVEVQYRTSDSPADMGDWSTGYLTPVELSGMLQRYFQYRLNMSSGDPDHSPVVEWFRLNWDPTGIEGGQSRSTPAISIQGGNPATGSLVIEIGGSASGGGVLDLFDCSGRLVFRGEVGPQEQGVTLLEVDPLPSGTYRAVHRDCLGNVAALSVVLLSI